MIVSFLSYLKIPYEFSKKMIVFILNILLFVVLTNPLENSLIKFFPTHSIINPYPPGPGFPIDEPSVYIFTFLNNLNFKQD